jgi:RNA polymerase sigma factor (sigma-70 family)
MTKRESGFEEIYAKFSQLVYNIALSYLQNREDAEEITQDTFVQIHHSFDRFESKSSLKTWIYRITINKCLDHLKAKKRKKRLAFISSLFLPNGQIVHEPVDFLHPGILAEQKENAGILFQVIDTLPENQKTAFLLSKVEGLSNEAIGEIMNASLSAVESYLFRAKKNLRTRIEKKYPSLHKKK